MEKAVTDLQTFFEEYDDLVDDIVRADHRNFALRLSDWLGLLDASPHSQAIVADLARRVDFESWYAAGQQSVRNMGSGRLDWSSDRTERLGQYLCLVRHLASKENAYLNFSSGFMWAGKNLNDNVTKIADDLITPFARDLRKHLQRSTQTAAAPASDRLVRLDDNSASVRDIRASIAGVEMHLENSNSLKFEPDFDRNFAEIGAARRLLNAASVRVEALRNLVIPALQWVGSKTAEHALQVAVSALLIGLAGLLGIVIPGLG